MTHHFQQPEGLTEWPKELHLKPRLELHQRTLVRADEFVIQLKLILPHPILAQSHATLATCRSRRKAHVEQPQHPRERDRHLLIGQIFAHAARPAGAEDAKGAPR